MIFFERVFGPGDAEVVVQVEQTLGISFPSEYRRFLCVSDGGIPEENIHQAGGREVNVSCFFGVAIEDRDYNLLANHSGEYPEAFVPIARDDGGNLFLIDAGAGQAGAIWFWDRDLEGLPDDSPLLQLNDDFRSFLGTLEPYP